MYPFTVHYTTSYRGTFPSPTVEILIHIPICTTLQPFGHSTSQCINILHHFKIHCITAAFHSTLCPKASPRNVSHTFTIYTLSLSPYNTANLFTAKLIYGTLYTFFTSKVSLSAKLIPVSSSPLPSRDPYRNWPTSPRDQVCCPPDNTCCSECVTCLR